MRISPSHYATVLHLTPGGEREVAHGTVEEILELFAAGKIGRPGGMSMRLAGDEEIILGRQLAAMVDAFKAGDGEGS